MLCFSHFDLIVDVVFSYNIILDAFPARCGGEMPAILMDCRILGTFCVDRLLFFSVAGEQMGLVGSFHEVYVIYGHVRCIYETEREFWK